MVYGIILAGDNGNKVTGADESGGECRERVLPSERTQVGLTRRGMRQ